MPKRVDVLFVVYREGLKVVVVLYTWYLKEKQPLRLEGDEIKFKLLTETSGVKSKFFMLEYVAIILCQVSFNTNLIFKKIEMNSFLVLKPWKIFALDIFYTSYFNDLLFLRFFFQANAMLILKMLTVLHPYSIILEQVQRHN